MTLCIDILKEAMVVILSNFVAPAAIGLFPNGTFLAVGHLRRCIETSRRYDLIAFITEVNFKLVEGPLK